MICNVEINDKNLKEALYTLFGQTALDDLIKETVSQDLEYVINNKDKGNTGVFVDLDDIKTNPYNLQIVEDKLFIPAKHFNIFPISETEWNPYPEIEPEVDEKERWSQWLVQTKEGELKVAYYYHKVTILGNYQVNDIGNGWHFLKLRELEPEQNIIAFKKLPELYKENVEN